MERLIINKALALKMQRGDTKALKLFFKSFYPSAHIFAQKYVKRIDVAEDIAQDSFVQYWNKRENFSEINQIKAFLYTVTRNACLNYLQQVQTREEIHKTKLYTEELTTELIIEQETYRMLHKAIEMLPERTKQIISLSLKGYKNNEIAEDLGVSINTIKTLKKNAYSSLRLSLQGQLYMVFVVHQILN